MDFLPLEIQVKILVRIDDFCSMLRFSNQNTQLRGYLAENQHFKRKYLKRHYAACLYFDTLNDVPNEYAQYLQPWFIVYINLFRMKSVSLCVSHFIARYNLTSAAEKLCDQVTFLPENAHHAILFTAIKYGNTDIIHTWFGIIMSRRNMNPEEYILQYETLLFYCIKAQSSQCFAYLKQYVSINYADDNFVSAVSNLTSLSFANSHIKYTKFSHDNFLVILKVYVMHLKTDMFLNALNQRKYILDERFAIYLLKQIILCEYCEELERMVRILIGRVAIDNFYEIWSINNITPCREVFLIWFDALKQRLTLRAWLGCVHVMAEKYIADRFLDPVVALYSHFTMDEARVVARQLLVHHDANMIRLLKYPVIANLFDRHEKRFYLGK